MSDAEEKNDKRPGEEEDLPTASFSGSVAIKGLPVEVMENPKARSRFSREARLLASVNHPNVVMIHEVLEEAGGVGDIAPVNTWFDGGYLWI